MCALFIGERMIQSQWGAWLSSIQILLTILQCSANGSEINELIILDIYHFVIILTYTPLLAILLLKKKPWYGNTCNFLKVARWDFSS